MSQQVLPLLKPIGLTPLQLINLLKEKNPSFVTKTLGFAGRLDPMAEGVLIVLVDEENKKRQSYEAMPKIYDFSAVFGIETDTYDTLGKIIASTEPAVGLKTKLKKILPSSIGKRSQPYPPYSSRTVDGKPLYYYARRNLLKSITIPSKEREIKTLTLQSSEDIPGNELNEFIATRIEKVQGDFRQKEIISDWKTFFSTRMTLPFSIFRFRISCSSGTYVRSLVHEVGQALGCGATTLSINRLAVGPYTVEKAIPVSDFALL